MAFKLMAPLPWRVWFAILLTLIALTLSFLITILAYKNSLPTDAKCQDDPINIIICTIGGITESYQSLSFKYGKVGHTLVLLWCLLAYFLNTTYNANLREFIIGKKKCSNIWRTNVMFINYNRASFSQST